MASQADILPVEDRSDLQIFSLVSFGLVYHQRRKEPSDYTESPKQSWTS